MRQEETKRRRYDTCCPPGGVAAIGGHWLNDRSQLSGQAPNVRFAASLKPGMVRMRRSYRNCERSLPVRSRMCAPGHDREGPKLRPGMERRVAKGTHVIFFHRGTPASAARSLTMRSKATR